MNHVGRVREGGATLAIGVAAIAMCAALLAWDPMLFWHDDCQIGALPVWVEFHRAISAGEWPLLSPYTWNAGGLAGEYQPGVFSPIVVPMAVLAVSLGSTMPGIAGVYATGMLALTAMGGFRVARGEGLPIALAALVAVVAAFNGWIVAWGASNWMPVIAGYAMLLWSWWALAAAMARDAGPGRVVLAGALVALHIGAGWPHTLFGMALVSAWLLLRAVVAERSARPLLPLAAASAIGVGLSAPSWLTFLEYLGNTNRRHDAGLQTEWVVPLQALAGLVTPAPVTTWLAFGIERLHVPIELANGLVPTAALMAALVGGRARVAPAVAWPLGFAAILLLICCLPSYGMFRWSFRWLPLFHVVAALAAAHWLHGRWAIAARDERPETHPALWAVGLVVAATALAAARPVLPWSISWAYIAGAVTWAAIELTRPPGDVLRRWAPAGVAAALLGATYVVVPTNIAVPQWQLTEAIRRPAPLDPAVRYVTLANDRDYWIDGQARPNWGVALRPGNTPMLAGVEFLNGYSALHPSGFDRAFQSENHGWLQPIAIDRTARLRVGPKGLLARLGVDGMVVSPRVRGYVSIVFGQGWKVVAETPDGTVLHRPGPPSPRVAAYEAVRYADPEVPDAYLDALDAPDGTPILVAGPGRPVGGMARYGTREVRLARFGRNEAAVDVGPGDRPALVAVRRMWQPGWQASLGGQALEVLALDGTVPAVEVPAGLSGRLELVYRPRPLVMGLGIAAGTLALTLAVWALFAFLRRPAGAAVEA